MENTLYSEVIENSIKSHFERNGELANLRSGLHVKAMKIMQELNGLEKNEPLCACSLEQRGLPQLLNYLIIDYFSWHGYKNTLETFAIETGEKPKPKPREKLQRELNIKFKNADLPILLHMLLKESKMDNENLFDASKWEHIPINKLKKAQGRNRAQVKANKIMKKSKTIVDEKDIPAEGKPTKENKLEYIPQDNDIPSEGKSIIFAHVEQPRETPSNVKSSIKSSIAVKDLLVKENQKKIKKLSPPNAIPNKVKSLGKFDTASKDVLPKKASNKMLKVLKLHEPILMVKDMPVKEKPTKKRNLRKGSTVVKTVPAKRKFTVLDSPGTSSSAINSFPIKHRSKKTENLRDTKMSQTNVNVRHNMVKVDREHPSSRAR